MRSRPHLVICVSALLAGCGYIGDPLPPALNIPVAVKDLQATQRGDRIFIAFTPNLQTTDGLILSSFESIDLRIGPGGPTPFDPGRWESTAKKVPVPATASEAVIIDIPAAEWAGQEVILGVRTQGPTGRFAGWSNWVVLNVSRPMPRPASLRATAQPDAVLLEWQPGSDRPGPRWRIWRQAAEEKELTPLGESDKPEFRDSTAQYGTKYTYSVQQLEPAGPSPVESELADPVTVAYEDRFAPLPPTQVNAIGGINSVELEWEAVAASDLAGYIVWRSEGDAPFRKMGDPVTVPSFSDKEVRSGVKYRYKIASVDTLGNESTPGAPVEFTAP